MAGGCGKKDSGNAEFKAAMEKKAKELLEKATADLLKSREVKKKKEKKYVYRTKNVRNPFVPPGLKAEGDTIAGGIDISMLELRGIIESTDKEEKYALVTGPGGKSFIVKGSKLIGLNNKVVPGVTSSVEKDRVILNTRKHYMRVLRIKSVKFESLKLEMKKVKEK